MRFWAPLIRKRQCSRCQGWMLLEVLAIGKCSFQKERHFPDLPSRILLPCFCWAGRNRLVWGQWWRWLFSSFTSLDSIFCLQCFSLPGTFGCTKSEWIYNPLLLEGVAGRQMTTVPLIEYYYKRSVNYLLASHAVEKLIWMTFSRCCC